MYLINIYLQPHRKVRVAMDEDYQDEILLLCKNFLTVV